ncbi:MAG: DNA methyltransferase [bacterium]|nr:DNA methyltransferase [bacterium]
MQYFFILGNNPTISFAELAAVLDLKPAEVLFLSKEILIIDVFQEVNPRTLIKRLGGTIKIGEINDEFLISNVKKNANVLMSNVQKSIKAGLSGKFNFGISYYGAGKFNQEKILAMEFKKSLKEKSISSRWVTSKEKTLSSVVVEQNRLVTDRGLEIVIIKNSDKYYIGKTLAVQPFKELSARDYGRPGRDDYSGMLPPKLAQIMINFAKPLPKPPLFRGGSEGEVVLLDPFCGSGTILTEAMLMGYRNFIGCDKSEKAVFDTIKNLEWMQKQYDQWSIVNSQLSVSDVRRLSEKISPNSIDAIVTEPYLGPSRMQRDKNSLNKVIRELEELYRQALSEFAKVLKPDGRAVMIWPVFVLADNQKIYLNSNRIISNSSLKIISPIAGFNHKVLELTNRNTLLYGRPDQKVWREIVILEK